MHYQPYFKHHTVRTTKWHNSCSPFFPTKHAFIMVNGAGVSSTSVGPSPGNWLATHRAELTLGKTAICIFVAKFYGRICPYFQKRTHFWQSKTSVCTLLAWAVCSTVGTMNKSGQPLDHCYNTVKSAC